MNRHIATAMALALVLGAAGLSAAPLASAVSPDCNDDYQITSQTRTLAGSASEVGLAEVDAPLDHVLTVTLDTNNDKLEFGIFEMVSANCVRSTNVSNNCDQDVVLDTTDAKSTDSIDCTLEAPLSGVRDFFVVFENQQADGLQYTVDLDVL